MKDIPIEFPCYSNILIICLTIPTNTTSFSALRWFKKYLIVTIRQKQLCSSAVLYIQKKYP
jgi:hypothetical protein